MPVKIVRSSEQKRASWSGGTTAELYIYPPSANYADRDFFFRISTATIEIEESEFTSLPGFTRQLMVLRGNLALRHNREQARLLKPFEIDVFDGAWETIAKGKVTDFNLMLSPQANGILRHFSLTEGKMLAPDSHSFAFIYVVTGSLQLNETNINAGDFAIIRNGESLKVIAETDADLVFCEVQLLD